MTFWLVQAKPRLEKLGELRGRLDAGEIEPMEPFGPTLHHSLDQARLDGEGNAVWEEEDYCTPPLAQEREAVLDAYFDELTVLPVQEGQGWAQIEALPSLWSELE